MANTISDKKEKKMDSFPKSQFFAVFHLNYYSLLRINTNYSLLRINTKQKLPKDLNSNDTHI